jgi:hypothetical protein
MMGKIVDYDPHTGITETFVKDASTGKISINQAQDFSLITKLNTEQRNNAQRGFKGEWHKVASIPLVMVEMWRNEMKAQGHSNPDPLAKENKIWLMAKLNSRDFTKLRTKEGRI